MAATLLQETRTNESTTKPVAESTALGPLLVAVDGTVRSDAAVRAARAIAERTGQELFVLSVVQPLPVMGPDMAIGVSVGGEAETRAARRAQVEEQLERVGITERWPMYVAIGNPATSITTLAGNIAASLIVMGLGGHGVLDRVLGDELVLQVVRVGTVPVLAVADSFEKLPRSVLAAVDFSPSSKRAYELGVPLVRFGGCVTLAHVLSSAGNPVNWLAVDPPRVGTVRRRLDLFAAEAELPNGVRCEPRVVTGDPAHELLRLAGDIRAELIVTGSHGLNFLSRLLIGSVSTSLLRKAGCSILIAPPVEGPDFVAELLPEMQRFAFYQWSERLEEFTRRNAGRRARLEVIDPDLGAQVVEDDVPLLGASFDARDSRVYLMFGGNGREHFTHQIGGITAIQKLRDRAGADVMLRIGHGSGQTLLTLLR
jgi:nucleotide-binding universal stress UspA family protein